MQSSLALLMCLAVICHGKSVITFSARFQFNRFLAQTCGELMEKWFPLALFFESVGDCCSVVSKVQIVIRHLDLKI